MDHNPIDDPSSTPLDLLLNAITGAKERDGTAASTAITGGAFPIAERSAFGDASGLDEELNLHGLLADEGYDFSALVDDHAYTVDPFQQPRVNDPTSTQADEGRVADEQVVHRITRYILESHHSSLETALSSIQVWHPTAGQKSYGKERRLLIPAPFVRVSGPISSSLSSLTLSTVHSAETSDSTSPTSSQTHRVASSNSSAILPASPSLVPLAPPQSKKARTAESRRLFKENAARSGFGATLPSERAKQAAIGQEVLAEGLSFPGLWIGQTDTGSKDKLFRLRLDARCGNHSRAAVQAQTPLQAAVPLVFPGLDSVDPDITLHDASMSVDPAVPPAETDGFHGALQTTLTLHSSPITIVSKPSQKTAKSRSVSSCMPQTASFALWVRINAQTVRTKYMKLEQDGARGDLGSRLTSRTAKWTPFRFETVHRAELVRSEIMSEPSMEVLTYGSVVRLVDVQSGTKSEAVRLARVDKNEHAAEDYGQPISELQRIGLIRVDDQGVDVVEDGKRMYLSAPGARLGGGELRDQSDGRTVWIGRSKKADLAKTPEPVPETLEQIDLFTKLDSSAFDLDPGVQSAVEPPVAAPAKKRLKTKRNALAAAVVAEHDSAATVCTWTPADRRMAHREDKVGKDVVSRTIEVDVVEDWMCWVIAGVDEFTHTFLDLGSSPPALNPVRLLRDPMHSSDHLELTLTHFYTTPPNPIPLGIYLGPLGPLHAICYRSMFAKDPLKDQPVPAHRFDGEVTSQTNDYAPLSNFPAGLPHEIVRVRLPSTAEVVRTMQHLAAQIKSDDGSARPVDASWLDPIDGDGDGDLDAEGKEAIRQALQTVATLDAADTVPEHALDPSLQARDPAANDPTLIAMTVEGPRVTDQANALVPLPLFLVSRDTAFGLGWSMAAVREGDVWSLRLMKA